MLLGGGGERTCAGVANVVGLQVQRAQYKVVLERFCERGGPCIRPPIPYRSVLSYAMLLQGSLTSYAMLLLMGRSGSTVLCYPRTKTVRTRLCYAPTRISIALS